MFVEQKSYFRTIPELEKVLEELRKLLAFYKKEVQVSSMGEGRGCRAFSCTVGLSSHFPLLIFYYFPKFSLGIISKISLFNKIISV